MLPDNVLLEIFNFYRNKYPLYYTRIQWWTLLVHVCQRWRQVVFESPHRLNLQILCTRGIPVKKDIGIWPNFPIVIDFSSKKTVDEKNVMAALEHSDRVCSIELRYYTRLSHLENMVTAMQKPFPLLTHLGIALGLFGGGDVPAIPAEFSAPRLREITLSGIPYPALPKLLLSTSDLVKLDIFDIPPTGYISPEAMAASLAALPRLETLVVRFQLATSRPDRMHPPPLTRTVLPALTYFQFKGASEYLEDLVARIDGPQLNQIVIAYLNQVIDFQVVQFSNFIDRTVGPEIARFRHAQFSFSYGTVAFTMYPHANHSPWDRRPVTTIISCNETDWQVSHITQVLSHVSAKLSNVVHLKLKVEPYTGRLKGTEDVEWLHLLQQFSALQTLHVSPELAGHVALALEGIEGETVDDVLLSLNLIRIVDQPASSIKKFIAARQLSGRPVTVIDTEAEFDEKVESYVSE